LRAVLVVAFGILVWRWTAGFSAWTFEDRRRLLASRGELVAPPIVIVDDAAAVRTLWSKDEHRTVRLVTFVYTRCASVCSALGGEDLQLQRELEQGPPTSIRLVTLSFDTARDDTHSLHRYATRFHADPRWWTVAAPTDPRAGASLREALGVVAVPDAFGGYVHNGDIHLIDAEGRLRGIFDFANWSQALQAARHLDAEARGHGAA